MMHLNLKPYLIILTSVIMIFIVFGLLRNFVFQKQLVEWGEKNEPVMKAIVFAAFLICVAVAVPLFLKLFVTQLIRIGNGELPLVKSLRQNPMAVIYTVWIVFGLGLAMALPMMIKTGFFSNME